MIACRSLNGHVARGAARHPEKVLLEDVRGGTATYREVDDAGRRWADVLAGLGVGSGDNVAIMGTASAEWVGAWLGTNWLGARTVAINTAYVGRMLSYVLAQSQAVVLVIDSALLGAVAAVRTELPNLPAIVVMGDPVDEVAARDLGPGSATVLLAAAQVPALNDVVSHRVYGIIYTSGTTGPSKGVLVSWLQMHRLWFDGTPMDDRGPDDVFYAPFPMYHVTGQGSVYCAAAVGGRVVLRPAWKTAEYWSDVHRFGCTVSMLVGAMGTFLEKQAPSELERGHRLRRIVMSPLPPDVASFEARFGFRVWSAFAMTEVGSVTLTGLSPTVVKTCGRLRPGYHARIVDGDGNDVPDGAPGEFLVKSDDPLALMQGYFDMPEETRRAWRGGWFHTGDVLRRDAEGNYFYLDRTKDSLRRRGENISSREVEAEALGHPDVLDCAAVGVPSELAEDEILLVAELAPGSTLGPGGLWDFLYSRAPRFMVPRYIEFCGALPRTASGRVQKYILRERGVTEKTWDRSSNAAHVDVVRSS